MTNQYDNSITKIRTRMFFNRKHSFYVPSSFVIIVYVMLVHSSTILFGVCHGATVPMVDSILQQPIQLHNDSIHIRSIIDGQSHILSDSSDHDHDHIDDSSSTTGPGIQNANSINNSNDNDNVNKNVMAITSLLIHVTNDRIAKQVILAGDAMHVKPTFSPVYCDTDTSDLHIDKLNATKFTVSLKNFNFNNEYKVAYLCLFIDTNVLLETEQQPTDTIEPATATIIYHLGLQSQFVR